MHVTGLDGPLALGQASGVSHSANSAARPGSRKQAFLTTSSIDAGVMNSSRLAVVVGTRPLANPGSKFVCQGAVVNVNVLVNAALSSVPMALTV